MFVYYFYSIAIVVHYINIIFYVAWPIRVKLVKEKGCKGLKVFRLCIIISVDFNDEQYN